MNSEKFLSLAASTAAQVDPHLVSPNPRVGCLIVRDGEVITTGVHEKFGGLHAEVNALKNLSLNSGSSEFEFYVTLEPCDSFPEKKTPSCVDLIISKNPKKVVIGQLDPRFCGKNVEKLRAAGIEVEVFENEKCTEINPFFAKFVKTKMPYVTVKLAQSLDGKIVNPEGDWISNEISRQRVHEMRAKYSALLTTTETIFADDPLLSCRLEKFHRPFSDPQVIVVGEREIPKNSKIFESTDRKMHFFGTHDLKEVLKECGEMGIDSIMTECGSTVCTELLRQDLVDEIQLFIAPKIFGGNGKSSFDKELSDHLRNFELVNVGDLDGDVFARFLKKR